MPNRHRPRAENHEKSPYLSMREFRIHDKFRPCHLTEEPLTMVEFHTTTSSIEKQQNFEKKEERGMWQHKFRGFKT